MRQSGTCLSNKGRCLLIMCHLVHVGPLSLQGGGLSPPQPLRMPLKSAGDDTESRVACRGRPPPMHSAGGGSATLGQGSGRRQLLCCIPGYVSHRCPLKKRADIPEIILTIDSGGSGTHPGQDSGRCRLLQCAFERIPGCGLAAGGRGLCRAAGPRLEPARDAGKSLCSTLCAIQCAV